MTDFDKTLPLIGITCDLRSFDGKSTWHAIRQSYVQAVLAAGGAPLLIPSLNNEDATLAVYRQLDGLLITGGADIDPALYGENPAGTDMDDLSAERDFTELLLARQAVADDLPLLGICRGHQVLNVALGGTLVQDIYSQVPESRIDHRGSMHSGVRSDLVHSVTLEPNCRLAGIFGANQIQVNSLHHQGVKKAGKGLQVVGHSPDGIVEASESRDNGWVMSVQWHPEELHSQQDAAARLFRAFVDFARERKAAGSLARV